MFEIVFDMQFVKKYLKKKDFLLFLPKKEKAC